MIDTEYAEYEDAVGYTPKEIADGEAELDRQRQLAEDVIATDLLAYEPSDQDDRTLCAYLRQCQQIASETATIKQQMEAMIAALVSRKSRLDWLYLPTVQRIVDQKLTGKKGKSIKTPWGTAGYRTIPDGLNITDEARLIVQADVRPELKHLIVCPPRYISKSELNQYVKKTGDLPDGVETIPAHEKFYCK